MNYTENNMSNSKETNQTTSSTKRKLQDESDEDCPTKFLNTNSGNFSRFIVLTSLDNERPLTKTTGLI